MHVLLLLVIFMWLLLEFDNFKGKKENKSMYGAIYPDDFFDEEEDLAGLPLMARRDFSGDDDRARDEEDARNHLEATTQAILPGILDPRFSLEQRGRAIATSLERRLDSKKHSKKVVTPVYLENTPTRAITIIDKEEEEPYELKDLKNVTEN